MTLFDDLTRCREWIEAALKHTGGTHTFDDIAAGCYLGKFRLLTDPEGCLVLEVHEFPRKRVLNVFLAGGRLTAGLSRLEDIDEVARELGASEITMTGRSGWERVLAEHGWQKEHVTMKRVLQ